MLCVAMLLVLMQQNPIIVYMNPPCRGNCPSVAVGGSASFGLYLDVKTIAGQGCLFDVRGIPCSAGRFCSGGVPPEVCPPGSFCVAGSSFPEPCPRECGFRAELFAHCTCSWNLVLQRVYLEHHLVYLVAPARRTVGLGRSVRQVPSQKSIGEYCGPPHVAASIELLASVLQPGGILLYDAGGQDSV